MDKKIESENKSQLPIRVFSGHNGLTVHIEQGKHSVILSIDQAAEIGVTILNHVNDMSKKYL